MGAGARAGLGLLALVFALGAAPPFAGVAVAQQSRDRALPGCGICYPGGYDLNTVGEVSGTIREVQVPDEGPVRFVVADGRERWVVLASPARFWENQKLPLAPGDSVSVRGSKTLGADGSLYLVAGEVRGREPGATVVLRDAAGAPLWSGPRRGSRMWGSAGDCRGRGAGPGRR